MSNTLFVSLDTTTTPWAVDVDQSNNVNHVGQSPSPQTITWQLGGNAAAGSFVALTDPKNAGFSWVGTVPSSNIFGLPKLNANGNQLTISDLNNSASTVGIWTYRLCVNVGGTVYTTITASIGGRTTNPTVRNT